MTGLPLPLGGNVIKRALGPDVIERASRVLRRSIEWALANRDEVITALLAAEQRPGVPRDRAMFDRYLNMYANRDTLDYGSAGRDGIEEVLRRGWASGIIPHQVAVEYSP
jgi:1,4-dihydroxy-6-naphthoate synthase